MKFSIRDLLLVTVIVALAVGWGAERWKRNSERVGYENACDVLERKAFHYANEALTLKQKLKEQAPAPNPPNP